MFYTSAETSQQACCRDKAQTKPYLIASLFSVTGCLTYSVITFIKRKHCFKEPQWAFNFYLMTVFSSVMTCMCLDPHWRDLSCISICLPYPRIMSALDKIWLWWLSCFVLHKAFLTSLKCGKYLLLTIWAQSIVLVLVPLGQPCGRISKLFKCYLFIALVQLDVWNLMLHKEYLSK